VLGSPTPSGVVIVTRTRIFVVLLGLCGLAALASSAAVELDRRLSSDFAPPTAGIHPALHRHLLRLSQALRHGRDASTGSVRLQGSSLEDALYLRGFVRTKRWEAEGKMALPVMLFAALRDFSQCKHHAQAPTARTKIKKYLMRTVLESFLAKLGAYAMFTAMAAVFVLVQLDFFFHGYGLLSPKKGIEDPLTYGTLTFGSFLFMIAALYLPDLLKLKVPGIELEKTAANQVSSPSSLGISRPGGLTS